jgi:hypothetical protein
VLGKYAKARESDCYVFNSNVAVKGIYNAMILIQIVVEVKVNLSSWFNKE